MEKFFENELDPYKDSEINKIKNEFIFKNLEKLKKESLGRSFNIAEIGYCGSNFTFIPKNCSLTLCNYLDYFEPFLLKNHLKYGRHLTFHDENFVQNLSQIKTGSMDAVICTHYLCSANDALKVIDEVYRVIRPVSFICYRKNFFCKAFNYFVEKGVFLYTLSIREIINRKLQELFNIYLDLYGHS